MFRMVHMHPCLCRFAQSKPRSTWKLCLAVSSCTEKGLLSEVNMETKSP